MKTLITKQIADRLEELAVQWKDHTSQAEALMMAAKIVMTFQEKEKEQIMDVYWDGGQDVPTHQNTVEEYYNKTYGGNK
jgi:hypothetical protein